MKTIIAVLCLSISILAQTHNRDFVALKECDPDLQADYESRNANNWPPMVICDDGTIGYRWYYTDTNESACGKHGANGNLYRHNGTHWQTVRRGKNWVVQITPIYTEMERYKPPQCQKSDYEFNWSNSQDIGLRRMPDDVKVQYSVVFSTSDKGSVLSVEAIDGKEYTAGTVHLNSEAYACEPGITEWVCKRIDEQGMLGVEGRSEAGTQDVGIQRMK